MSETTTGKNYYTPLPGVFAGLLQQTLNRQLEADPQAQELIRALGERVLAIELQGTGIDLYFSADESLQVSAEHSAEVDTWIRGTPMALFGMAKPDLPQANWINSGSKVIIEGDASLVRDFEALMKKLDFNWEEKTSELLGDVVAHQLGLAAKAFTGFAKNLSQFGREVGRSGLKDIVAKQAGSFTSKAEFSEFRESLDNFTKDLDKLDKSFTQKAGD
ncbi:MAG: SCP2 sterol-binding domain-containing protein [Xanthomonadales bacterium]|nr:SCP2 sterol-binding domain-containing protein [Xanthomonadales bacterium]